MFDTRVLEDGKLVLMKRKQSSSIYARYKHPILKVWREKSTGTADPEEAAEFARRFYAEMMWKVDNNVPIGSHPMEKLIKLYLNQLDREFKHGTRLSESNYRQKVRITHKFVKPFFTGKLLHLVNREMLKEFALWRRSYWSEQPDGAIIEYMRSDGRYSSRPVTDKERQSYSHMRDERAILNSMFRIAVTKGWIKEYEVPKVDFGSDVIPKGRTKSKIKPEAFFDPREYQLIKEKMQPWSERYVKFRYRRIAAYYYVMLCFTTGVRPGTAMDSVRWRDLRAVASHTGEERAATKFYHGLEFVPSSSGDMMDGTRLDIHVPYSKVGSYRSIGMEEAFWFKNAYEIVWRLIGHELKERRKRVAKHERVDIMQDIDPDKPIFLLPNGYHLKGEVVSRYFAEFLEEVGMTYQSDTGDKRSLYSTRHSFITYMQSQGVPDGVIAEFTGTSLEMIKKHYSHQRAIAVGLMFRDYDGRRER